MLLFEWNAKKAKKNVKVHGISFDEASTVFGDALGLSIYDPLHSANEDRFILIGNSHLGRLLVVVHTEIENTIRLISARHATKKERKQYEANAKRSRHA
ncbi:MAG: BrnT family toxin [Deltaproteobacteria bacterium]|nr:BrnT family toxin [Deltaproteobacteria bacterium]